jgi:hypothetical protein
MACRYAALLESLAARKSVGRSGQRGGKQERIGCCQREPTAVELVLFDKQAHHVINETTNLRR